MKAISLSNTIILALALSFCSGVQAQSDPLGQEVSALRPLGYKGLQQFLKNHETEFKAALPPKPLRDALDQLCKQRDCYASKLYWHTDLEKAKSAARNSGKPILSLRLLGQLDQDLSCANSRFFRVALYPNTQVSQLLRERFILHWQSVRPVPKVTIDFGDGRKLERTLTGNSIHYVLDSEGRTIEAIPGLYGPQAFLHQLQQSEGVVNTAKSKIGFARYTYFREYYQSRLNSIQAEWSTQLTKLGLKMPSRLARLSRSADTSPRADLAGTVAISKMTVENPIVSATLNQNTLAQMTDQTTWEKLALRYTQEARLDERSIRLLQAKQTAGVPIKDRSISAMVRSFESAMALDSVRNEYMLHSQIYQWLLKDSKTLSLDDFNDKVYKELFLTPKNDPWLGLLPSDSYSAIDNDGISKN